MFATLFDLAGPAIAGWALMILLPRWRVTRWLARSAVLPVYLALLYVVGIAVLMARTGPGIINDFGSSSGVVRLLADADAAIVVWIHILVFDHLVGIFIYRDNMRERIVPLPVQSVILFLTLMFGPAGFLLYYTLRIVQRRGPAIGEPVAGTAIG